jgi:hypothetical protein
VTQLVVGAGRDALGLGDVVGEALDLAVDAREARDELVALHRGRTERTPVPAERAPAQIVADDLVLGPLRGLLREELHAWPDLAKDVDDTHELDLGVLQALERVLAPHLEPARTGRLLDHDAPIGGAQRENLVHEALADDDERVVREVRAREQILQIAQPHARAIHEVLGLAVLVQAAADLDLVELDRQAARRVVELDDRLGHAEAAPRLAAREDELLVLLRAKDPRVVLTERPADRVRHVGFPAAIRADDRGDARREFQVRRMDEALESGERQRLEDRVRA